MVLGVLGFLGREGGKSGHLHGYSAQLLSYPVDMYQYKNRSNRQ